MKKIRTSLKQYLACKKMESILIKRARDSFKEKYPNRKLLSRRSKPEKTRDGAYIVTVFFDNMTKPSGRSWWKLYSNSNQIDELSYEEAEILIKVPLWR